MSGRCEGPDHSWADCPWHEAQAAGAPLTGRTGASDEDPDIQAVAARPTRTLADLFRAGRAKGWFKGAHNYQA